MSTAAVFIPLLHAELAELKKVSSSVWHRQLRECISETEVYLQKLNTSKEHVKFDLALEPFFRAISSKKKSDIKLFQPVFLDCIYGVFGQSTPEFYPDRELTQRIINILIHTDGGTSDEINLKCCNVCIACLRSPSGIYFCHGRRLRQLFELLFRIYNNSENPNAFNSIKTSIHETLLALFDSYLSPPELPHTKTVEDFSRKVLDGLWQNSIEIVEFMGPVLSDGDYAVTIRDVDVFAVLGLMAKLIESNTLRLSTVKLAAECLVTVLSLESEFYSRNSFRVLLQTKIHVAVMALSLDPRAELASVTAELILLLWRRFADIYVEHLNEVLVKGLATALTSPDGKTLLRALQVYKELAKNPNLFVHSFVNYDCDESGFFPNVFANTMSQIVKLAYPNANHDSVHKLALDVLVTILENLWLYFDQFSFSDASVDETKTQIFLQAKHHKDVLEKDLDIFKTNPKKGLNLLIEHGCIEDKPEAIAKYFFENKALDPSSTGEILGGHGKRNIDILNAYVGLFDFRGSTFEHAFRQFLSSFQIPGEAQMIGRVMEAFGQKYYNDNPTMFSCADTVYVLSYSALMLHTDAHHPNVKSRMTLEQFLSNNKGIDGGKDLPREFLEELYNGIRSKKIFCSNGASMPSTALLTREQRADLFAIQAQEALNKAKERIQGSKERRQFHRSESPLFIGPMFEAIWQGTLASLTMSFEQSHDKWRYMTCLQGLTVAVHLASHCFIDDALTTLIDAFTKFSALRWKRMNEIQEKNIECCNALISIAFADGNFLRSAWSLVIDQLSELAKIRDDFKFGYDVAKSDELFEYSARLDRESIVTFVMAVCQKSREELQEVPPHSFLLEKLGIVAQVNVKREHFIWIQLWNYLGEYIGEVGSFYEGSLSNLAVDILRRLSRNLLQQAELTQFHFQKKFMQPFMDIFEKHKDPKVKDFVLISIREIINERASNLQSGWSVIFSILKLSAKFPETQASGFSITECLINDHIDTISSLFVSVVAILESFISNSADEIKIQAIPYLTKVASNTRDSDLPVWKDLFGSFVSACLSKDDKVRKVAHNHLLTNVDAILTRKLDDSFLRHVLSEILPRCVNDDSLTTKTFYVQIAELLRAFSENIIDKHYYDILSRFLPELLCVMNAVILSPSRRLSGFGIGMFKGFIQKRAETLDEDKLKCLWTGCSGIVDRVLSLHLENQTLFISVILTFVELFKRMDFVDLLYQTDKECGEAEQQRNTMTFWSGVRLTLLKALMVLEDEAKEKIIECVYGTLDLYHRFEFASQPETAAGAAWNTSLNSTLEIMTGFSDELFERTFDKSSALIVKTVGATSLEVRKHVNQILKRKLVK